jgi:hypothetical protein
MTPREINDACQIAADQLAERFQEFHDDDRCLIVVGNTPAYITQHLPSEIRKIHIPFSGKGIQVLVESSNDLPKKGTWFEDDDWKYVPGQITPHHKALIRSYRDTLISVLFAAPDWSQMVFFDHTESGVSPIAFKSTLLLIYMDDETLSNIHNISQFRDALRRCRRNIPSLDFLNLTSNDSLERFTAQTQSIKELPLLGKYLVRDELSLLDPLIIDDALLCALDQSTRNSLGVKVKDTTSSLSRIVCECGFYQWMNTQVFEVTRTLRAEAKEDMDEEKGRQEAVALQPAQAPGPLGPEGAVQINVDLSVWVPPEQNLSRKRADRMSAHQSGTTGPAMSR